MIIPLITGGIGLVKEWFTNKREIAKADHDIKLAGKQNRARLLRDIESNNHEWEMRTLENKDRFLRRFSFLLFALPFIWAMFDPQQVKNYFDVALSAMPAWYIKMFAGIVGGVWGLSELKNALSGVFKK